MAQLAVVLDPLDREKGDAAEESQRHRLAKAVECAGAQCSGGLDDRRRRGDQDRHAGQGITPRDAALVLEVEEMANQHAGRHDFWRQA